MGAQVAHRASPAVATMTGKDKPPRGWRRLTEEERRLWAGVTRSIAPLRPTIRSKPLPAAETPAREKASHPAPRRRVETAAAARPASNSAPVMDALDRRLKQRLARGSQPIDARLDLHG